MYIFFMLKTSFWLVIFPKTVPMFCRKTTIGLIQLWQHYASGWAHLPFRRCPEWVTQREPTCFDFYLVVHRAQHIQWGNLNLLLLSLARLHIISDLTVPHLLKCFALKLWDTWSQFLHSICRLEPWQENNRMQELSLKRNPFVLYSNTLQQRKPELVSLYI